MPFVLKLLLICVLALVLPVAGLFLIGQSWLLGLTFVVAPVVIAWQWM